MAGKKKIEEPVKETKKTITAKKATKAAPKKAPRKTVVDTTAVEIPIEEPKIEAVEEKVDPVPEIFSRLADRYTSLGDNEKAIASKIFEDTKNEVKDSFSEDNTLVIAAASADAALFSMNDIMKSIEKQKKMENFRKEREENKKRRLQIRNEKKQVRVERRQTREQRRAALGITQ